MQLVNSITFPLVKQLYQMMLGLVILCHNIPPMIKYKAGTDCADSFNTLSQLTTMSSPIDFRITNSISGNYNRLCKYGQYYE